MVVVAAQPCASAELLGWCEGKVVKRWLCNDAVLVEALAHTATGETGKFALRRQPAGSRIPNERP